MKSQLLVPAVYDFLENMEFEGFDQFYEYAIKRDVPVVSKAVGNIISFFVSLFRPTNILELGCGIGTAAKYMLTKSKANYTGVDNNLERIEVAKRFLKDFNKLKFIHSRVETFLCGTDEKYDFVFVDSIKKDYEKIWYLLKPVLTKRSMVIFDDFFLYGYIFQEEAEIPYKYREGVRLIKRFINNIKNDPTAEIVFLPIENGIMVVHYEG
ncbi:MULTISPECIES: O-methyltransferase [Calditerrivibrio]|jgi:predicted O-methyltransferase YrrM|uniref:Methyltransferase domain-containing protein n=1 Tax=Calditerrivibrio nitroreducens TaxID=477976 RepID=A0A2J6WGM3_9BACT|nr:MAG: hypothetical protein C0187_06920 [Calditerrivibrio nitroreducens]